MRTRKHSVKFSGSSFKTFNRSCSILVLFFVFVFFPCFHGFSVCLPSILPCSMQLNCSVEFLAKGCFRGQNTDRLKNASGITLLHLWGAVKCDGDDATQLQEVFTQLTAGCWHVISWEGMLFLCYIVFFLLT